jgi:D-beta-D-heptose 7-phosphate kinase/D-beta-D-heptose 1-phosphate adenosyltransferase
MDKLPIPSGPILVVGDIMCDHYIWGEVERISPEAPVQVVKWEREANRPGGAANAAMNLAALGCEVHLVGILGRDDEGGWLLAKLQSQRIGTSGIVVSKRRATIVKTRVMARGQHMLRIDREPREPIDGADHATMLAAVSKLKTGAAGILCSDYNKGVLSTQMLRGCLAGTRAFTVVDPKRRDFRAYRGARLLTPNERELIEAGTAKTRTTKTRRHEDATRDDIIRTHAESVMRQYGFRSLLVTRGASGMDLFEANRRQISRTHVPALQRHEVFDVTGAGDTVAAVMTLGAASGLALPDAARLANAAAGLVVGSVGTTVADAEALRQIISGESSQARSKVLPRAALAARLSEARHSGAVVVFTSGAFDALGVDDLRALQRARAQGDLLVVGVQAKGKGGHQRAELVAALRFVDYVAEFEEKTPAALVRALQPDIVI